jgi:hypothetical protein
MIKHGDNSSSDTRSPLDRMIDEACGVTPLSMLSRTITLRCRICGAEMVTGRDVTDPALARIVLSVCPKHPDVPQLVTYLDADGRDMGGPLDQ